MSTIILTGGGTAGHCTPNLALLPYLKKKFNNIYYIGSYDGIEKQIIENANIPYYPIQCAKLRRSLTLKNLLIPFKVLKGIKEAEKLLRTLKPNVIFSKGGYVSVPTVIAAKKLKIPVIAHESDYSIGLANKLTSKYCKKVLTSFPETALKLKNGKYVGSPLKNSLYTEINRQELLKRFKFSGTKPILLVTGGSLGATAINNCLRQSLKQLLKIYDIIHICGKGNLQKQYDNEGYFQTEFLNDIENAFKIASVCVSRAGSNTLFELLSLKIPCLIIPLPKGNSRGDQVENAKYFKKLGVINVLFQEDMTKNSFINEINATYNNRQHLKTNLEKRPIINASEKIVNIILEYSQ